MNDFERDNIWQRRVRDAVLVPGFYKQYAVEGRYVLIDKGRLATILQKRYAVDTIVQGRDGQALCIEEKIVRWPGYKYAAFCLETQSCTIAGRESDGWMVYGKADFLLYCFEEQNGDLDCWLIDFPKLTDWFWRNEGKFPQFIMRHTLNKSAGRKVPVSEVHRSVPAWRRRIKNTQETWPEMWARPYEPVDANVTPAPACHDGLLGASPKIQSRSESSEGWRPNGELFGK